MSTSRAGSSGGGYERIQKRSNTGGNTTPAAPSSSSSSSAYAYPPPPRSDSPPASAYFPLLAADRDSDSARLRPIPDAESHFAYSTTLRRHHPEGHHTADIAQVVNAEAVSLWSRVVSHITGQPISSRDEDDFPHGRVDPKRDTASARFAHCSAEDTISHFRTSASDGLLKSEISTLLQRYGYNEFTVSTPEPLYIKFAKTIYESPLILLLCGSATVSALMGNVDDAISITVAVLIVLTVGFVQEQRSEKSLEALNKLVPHHCHVLRDRETLHVLANELVPGDIVKLGMGDRVPADLRIIEAVDFEIDESSLTGETNARVKSAETCSFEGSEPAALADRSCIAYMGTLVRNGRGVGVVVATGVETEFGVIFSMMQDVEEKRTPLQLRMDELAQTLSFMSFGIIGVICLIGVWQNRSWLEMFTIGVSLAVAAIPEGLPIVTTVTLALGVLRMAKRKAVVKKLHSVESLGSVSVICADKTGTLTKNEQTVIEAYTVDETTVLDPTSTKMHHGQISPALQKTLEIGSICNNASLTKNEDGIYVGQSTDVALLNVLELCGVGDARSSFRRTSERPFNSEKKSMAVSGVHGDSNREVYYTKGSIEAIIDRCRFYYVSEGSTPGLDASMRQVILGKAQETASSGLRVIALAYGYGSVSDVESGNVSSRAPTPSSENITGNLVFVGFQAMFDPPRKGVADSIALLQAGGVQVVMITGDSEETALSIARQLGLRVGSTGHGRNSKRLAPSHVRNNSAQASLGDASSYCLTGKAIDQLSKKQLVERVGNVTVFARTTPRHKMAIVEAFKARGDVVAMTGDGVNDAPALKKADIGVSMGRSGTDVAKEAADMILVDDNFSTILPAIEEGKSIFHNIQNFLSFQLSTAAAALTLITLSTMLGLSNPLNAMQILFINILMDGPPSQSLGVDPVDPAIMRRPPRSKDASIITRRLLYRVLFSASLIVVGTLFVYIFALEDDNMSRREQTMTFTAFVFLDLVSAVQNRGIGCGIFQNKMLTATVSVSALTQLALVYVPIMQSVFQTAALPLSDLSILLLLACMSFGLHEVRRRYERKLNSNETVIGRAEEMA